VTFARMQREYAAWNSTMLPYTKDDPSVTLAETGLIAEGLF